MISFIGFVLVSLIPAFIADKKGRSFGGYFLLSFLVSPLISTIITLCVPNISIDYIHKEAKKIGATDFEYLIYKKRIPDCVLEQCETMIGQEDDLRNFLNSCAKRQLIESAYIGIVWKEYACDRKIGADTLTKNEGSMDSNKICFCRKCGKSLLENSKFCRGCGTEIKEN